MSDDRRPSFQPFFVAAGGVLLAAVVLAGAADLAPRLGQILLGETPGGSEVPLVIRDLSRMLGVTLSMLVALCAIAIPLTANVYTPKLIELFVADKGNRIVLGYYVLANAFVLWNGFVVFDEHPETTRLRVFACLVLATGGLVMIVPYFYYVLRFLIPRTIVDRLEREVVRDLHRATRRKDGDGLARTRYAVLENVQYLGKIVLRSVDRYDRDTADQGLRALRSVFEAYHARKEYLPDAWFRPSRGEMQDLGPELAREALRQRAGLEVAILSEFSLILPIAVGRLPDVVATIARFTRQFGVRTTERRDLGAREHVTLFFNTFLRIALQKRHSDTFYKFIYQYRRFAEEILDKDGEHAARVAFFMDYYGHQAVRMSMGFLINVVAYDLSGLCDVAYRTNAACREELLAILIELDRDRQGLIDMPGVIKAQLILAAKLQTRGKLDSAKSLIRELRKVKPELLEEAFSQIVAAREENFWEIADRRRHLDHVEPRFRPAVDLLREHLLGPGRARGHDTEMFLKAVTETMMQGLSPISAPTPAPGALERPSAIRGEDLRPGSRRARTQPAEPPEQTPTPTTEAPPTRGPDVEAPAAPAPAKPEDEGTRVGHTQDGTGMT